MDTKIYDYVAIEQKWQNNWLKEKIYLANKEKSKTGYPVISAASSIFLSASLSFISFEDVPSRRYI